MNNFGLLDALTLIGALGMFLFGMNMMSESLQKVAGNKMRSILSSMTKNRFIGVLSGIIITSIIQSSSATTVLKFCKRRIIDIGRIYFRNNGCQHWYYYYSMVSIPYRI